MKQVCITFFKKKLLHLNQYELDFQTVVGDAILTENWVEVKKELDEGQANIIELRRDFVELQTTVAKSKKELASSIEATVYELKKEITRFQTTLEGTLVYV